MKHKSKSRQKFNSSRLALILICVAAILYYAYSRLPYPTPQPIGINEVGSSAPTVTLTFPGSIQVSPNTESSLDLQIDAGGSTVAAVQGELTYDPARLSSLSLTQGDFLTDKLVSSKIENGKITFVYTAPLGSGGKTGAGKLATLRFKASNDTELKFSSNTMVAVIGKNTNALKSATGTIITTHSTSPSAPPPTLTEIIATPTPFPSSTAKAVAPAKSAPTKSATVKTTLAPTPSFLPEQDFDYDSFTPTPSLSDTTTPESEEDVASPSVFTRFLTWVRTLFNW